jgi:hypothetical protein
MNAAEQKLAWMQKCTLLAHSEQGREGCPIELNEGLCGLSDNHPGWNPVAFRYL